MYLLISIHAPRTGSDIVLLLSSPKMISFQSTLPARGATAARARFAAASAAFQSTLPARGATLHMSFDNFESSISIHAPRTGSDADPRLKGHALDISIHAPRTGSDCVILSARGRASISIHAPRTGSDDYVCIIPNCPIIISIHAPRTGSDTRI